MKELGEGEIGLAKNHEVLKYPEVTSCLTVTCVLADGGKWGAHMSMFQYKQNLPHHVILQEMRTAMSSVKDLASVRKVLVVGALKFWPCQLNPGKGNSWIEGNEKETSKILKDRLGLQQLNSDQIGTHFVFENSDAGDVQISAGSSAGAIHRVKNA